MLRASGRRGAHLARALPVDLQQQLLAVRKRLLDRAHAGAVAVVEYPGVLQELVARDHLLETFHAHEMVVAARGPRWAAACAWCRTRRSGCAARAPSAPSPGWSCPRPRVRRPRYRRPRFHAPALLDVLHLLAHLLDQHLHVDRGARGLDVLRLRRQGVGLAVQLLHQEIQPPARGLRARRRSCAPPSTWPRRRSISSSTSSRCARIASSCSSRSWSTSLDAAARCARAAACACARAPPAAAPRPVRRIRSDPRSAARAHRAGGRPRCRESARARQRFAEQRVRGGEHRRRSRACRRGSRPASAADP